MKVNLNQGLAFNGAQSVTNYAIKCHEGMNNEYPFKNSMPNSSIYESLILIANFTMNYH